MRLSTRIRTPPCRRPGASAIAPKTIFNVQATLKILSILLSILVLPVKGSSALECPAGIEDFLSLTSGEVRIQLILGELSSVVKCDMQYGPVEIIHASLGDFLLDKQRSRQYHVDGKTHAMMARLCFQHINNQSELLYIPQIFRMIFFENEIIRSSRTHPSVCLSEYH